MLAIQRKQGESDKLKVNLLPCKINYSGPVEVEEQYWKPVVTEDGKQRSHFRGRALDGNVMKLPEGYRGAILRITEDVLPAQRPQPSEDDEDDEDEDQSTVETKAVQELGAFDEVTVWNHDTPWDATQDPYAKGINEWMAFAKAIHAPVTNDAAPQASKNPS